MVIKALDVPTLGQATYDTTLGNDKIVFYKRGTAKYNKQVHGGGRLAMNRNTGIIHQHRRKRCLV